MDRRKPKGGRGRDALDPLIDEAIDLAKCQEASAVFAQLCEMAKNKRPPLLEVGNRCILYSGIDNNPNKITHDALRKRLIRRSIRAV